MKKITLLLMICFVLTNFAELRQLFAHEDTYTIREYTTSAIETPTESEKRTSGYDESNEITLCHNGEVLTISLHDYLYGVLCAEIPASFPVEAIRAQTVAARTYTLNKLYRYEQGYEIAESHNGAQLCSDSAHCKGYTDKTAEEMWGDDGESYRNKLENAIYDTDGQYISYDNQPIVAVFHAASGKMTENASDVWGGDYPYLVSTESYGGEDSPKFHGEVRVPAADLIKKITEATGKKFELVDGYWIGKTERSEAGGVKTIVIGGETFSGGEIRSIFALNSTNFTITYDDGNFVFTTTGYGHCVGMS
ncbi:MAG: stage II sporulation protein D, partial [Clostridia bacterium]|nr:stage II sporulation protein D [Clostridia bacterium]